MHIRSGSSYAASQTTFLPPCAAKPWLTFASRKTVRWSSIGIEPILETAANKNKTFLSADDTVGLGFVRYLTRRKKRAHFVAG
jgi:hypothetical protein